VAPADPVKFSLSAAVRHKLPYPALVVGSDNDPWMSAERARHWAEAWGAQFRSVGDAGISIPNPAWATGPKASSGCWSCSNGSPGFRFHIP
jgi:hypothetical protein